MTNKLFYHEILPKFAILKITLSKYKQAIGIVLIGLIGLFLFIRNILIENAVIFHDEFLYKVRSDVLLNQSEITIRGIADEMPNKLFFLLYSAGTYFGENQYIFAKLLNTLFYCLAALPIFIVCKMVKLTFWESLLVVLVATCLPLNVMTDYFMPESLYYFLYWVMAAFFIYSIHDNSKYCAALSGFTAIAMYFVKPHAIVIILLNLVFISLTSGKDKIRLILLYLLGTVTGYVLFKYLGWGASQAFVKGAYGTMLDGVFKKLSSITGNFYGLISDISYVGLGHLFYISIFYVLPIILLMVIVFTKSTAHAVNTTEKKEITFLIAKYALVQLVVLASVSVIFTVLVGESGRLHFRYYAFLFPYFILVLFFRKQLSLNSKAKLILSVVITVFYLSALFYYKNYSDILNISFVSDGAEAGFNQFSLSSAILLAGMMCLTSILHIYGKKWSWTYLASITLLSLLVTGAAFKAQTGIFNNQFTKGREANFVEELLKSDELVNAVVVGNEKGSMSKFLFSLNALPHLEYKDAGSNVDDLYLKYPDSTYFIFLRQDYIQSKNILCNLFQNGIIICSKQNRLIRL